MWGLIQKTPITKHYLFTYHHIFSWEPTTTHFFIKWRKIILEWDPFSLSRTLSHWRTFSQWFSSALLGTIFTFFWGNFLVFLRTFLFAQGPSLCLPNSLLTHLRTFSWGHLSLFDLSILMFFANLAIRASMTNPRVGHGGTEFLFRILGLQTQDHNLI